MIQVGVGLRTDHYEAAMNPASIDFIEVHAENFFAEEGASLAVLEQVAEHYEISLHATSLGLGSAQSIPKAHLDKLKRLCDRFSPMLVSDHASFSWISANHRIQHAGDLLPIPFSHSMLKVMGDNIKRVQDVLGQQVLVENISSYLDITFSDMPEYAFFNQLCNDTGCGLLLDLHNLYINAVNQQLAFPLDEVIKHIDRTERDFVKEIHLAGISDTSKSVWIDDHSGPVSDDTWLSYEAALQRFGEVPTLIEWDTQLPSWQTLVAESSRAKSYANEVYAHV